MLSCYSCGTDTFTKDLWMKQLDGSYTHRKSIVYDFISTYQDSVLSYEDAVLLLGEPRNVHLASQNTMYYLIETKPKYSADPDYYVSLELKLNRDSLVESMEITKR